jgi:hypothetical protein
MDKLFKMFSSKIKTKNNGNETKALVATPNEPPVSRDGGQTTIPENQPPVSNNESPLAIQPISPEKQPKQNEILMLNTDYTAAKKNNEGFYYKKYKDRLLSLTPVIYNIVIFSPILSSSTERKCELILIKKSLIIF